METVSVTIDGIDLECEVRVWLPEAETESTPGTALSVELYDVFHRGELISELIDYIKWEEIEILCYKVIKAKISWGQI